MLYHTVSAIVTSIADFKRIVTRNRVCYLQERLLRHMPAAALQAAASSAQQDSVKRALLQGFVSVRLDTSIHRMLLVCRSVHAAVAGHTIATTRCLTAATCSHENSLYI
jgi:hypothetical protein